MAGTRPTRDQVLMESAWLWSKRSTCSRLHVGAVFAREGRILVTGYNGAPAGLPHCDHTCNCPEGGIGRWDNYVDGGTPGQHGYWCASVTPCIISEHAERNGVAFAARNGVRLEGCEVFVTNMPCLACSMTLINAGVERIVYDQEYRIHDGVALLRQAGITLDVHHVEMIR